MDQKVFCSICGKENEPGAKFCVFCGSKVNIPGAQQTEPVVEAAAEPSVEAAVEPSVEPAAEPVVEVTETVESTATEQTKAVEQTTAVNNTYSQNVAQNVATTTTGAQQYYYTENSVTDNGYKGVAIASLICGIVSLLCCCCGGFNFLVAIAAVVLGIVALVKKFSGKGMAIAGIVCGGIAVLLTLIVMITSASSASILSEVFGPEFEDTLEEIYDDMGMDYDF